MKTGQVLARLDTGKLQSQVLKSGASLESALAKLVQAQTTSIEHRNEFQRLLYVCDLSGGKAVSQHDLVAAEAALKRALADESSAKAQIAEAEAILAGDNTNLSKANIRSPIDGIVLDRKIEPGQTVATSLSTPMLFTIAESLSKMELHADIDEVDVGQVKKGHVATFAVDAYPDRKFPAKVDEVRLSAKTVAGVVTYEAVLSATNPDLALRLGMTATAEIIVKNVENALLVLNAALRFTPPEPEQKASGSRRGIVESMLPRPRGSLFSSGAKTYSVGPSVSWPIFDAGAIRSNIEVQSALKEQALLAYQSTVLSALKEVQNSLVAYSEEQHRRDALMQSANAAEQAVSLARDKYKGGLVGFTTVLDAQRSLFSFQGQLATSEGTVTTNLVGL